MQRSSYLVIHSTYLLHLLKSSMETLMKEIDPVWKEKSEFASRKESLVFAFFEFFGTSRCWQQDQIKKKLNEMLESCIFGDKWNSISREFKLFERFGIPSMWGSPNDIFQQTISDVKFFWPQRSKDSEGNDTKYLKTVVQTLTITFKIFDSFSNFRIFSFFRKVTILQFLERCKNIGFFLRWKTHGFWDERSA